MAYTQTLDQRTYRFADLKEVLAKASPARSGDALAGVAAAGQLLGVVALSRQGFFSPSGGAPVLGAATFAVWIAAVSVELLVRRDGRTR